MAASNQTAVQGSIPAPAFAAYDPKDRTDPLHLHPSESPSLQLVTIPLEGKSNYHPRARAMEMALKSKNKMVLVDGSLTIPSNSDLKYFYWDQCNTMILSWILRAVSPTIGRSVLWINTAEGVWKDLKKRFSQHDDFRIAEIRYEIYKIKQGTSSIDEIGLESDIVLPSGEVSHLDTEEQVQDDSTDQIQSVPPIQDEEPVTEPPPEIQPRRSTRTRTVPSYLNDYTCQNATVKKTSPHTISDVLSYNKTIIDMESENMCSDGNNEIDEAIVDEHLTCATFLYNEENVMNVENQGAPFRDHIETNIVSTNREGSNRLQGRSAEVRWRKTAVSGGGEHSCNRWRVMAGPRSAKEKGLSSCDGGSTEKLVYALFLFTQLLILSDIFLQRQKSKKEVMEEIILKSKFFKAQKAKDKEENEQFVEQLEWRRRQFSGTRKSKNLDEQSEVSSSKGKRKNIRRRRCEALMKVRLNDKGAYEVAHHITSHNHPLTRKEWVHLHRPERKITSEKAQAIETMISYGNNLLET
nr:uncharacterized protein LOC109166032 [Ipomoea batatas]